MYIELRQFTMQNEITVDCEHKVPIVECPQDIPIVECEQNVPIFECPQDIPIVEYEQDVPIVECKPTVPIVECKPQIPIVKNKVIKNLKMLLYKSFQNLPTITLSSCAKVLISFFLRSLSSKGR